MTTVSRAELMTIGQVATAAGVTRKALRVWTGRALLAVTGHTHAGYQLFTPDTVGTAVFIRRARALGLGLDVIARILNARRDSELQPCDLVRQLLTERIVQIDAIVDQLLTLCSELSAAVAAESGDRPAAVCGLIERRWGA